MPHTRDIELSASGNSFLNSIWKRCRKSLNLTAKGGTNETKSDVTKMCEFQRCRPSREKSKSKWLHWHEDKTHAQLSIMCNMRCRIYWKITPHTRSIGINWHDVCVFVCVCQYKSIQSGIHSPAPLKHFDVFLDSRFFSVVLVDAVSFEIR